MKRTIAIILTLSLLLSLAACAAAPAETEAPTPPPEEVSPPLEEEPPAPEPEPASYHIGIVTLHKDFEDDPYISAEELIRQYGSVEDGGIIQWVILPIVEGSDWEVYTSFIAGLADDPLMKAVIVNLCVPGTAAGFKKIRDAGRDDMLLLTAMPQEDLNVISKVADVIVGWDNLARGYYDILRAKNMGATAFVHLSFARHMMYEALSRRRNIYEEACKDLGLKFVFVEVPDPATEIGVAGAQQAVYDMMPRLVEQYGKDAVYFTTNITLNNPIIQQCLNLGAMFLNQDDISPLVGYPDALGIDLTAEAYDFQAIMDEIEAVVIAKGGSGRMGTWPCSPPYCNTTGLAKLAMNMIEGKGTGNVQNDLIAAYQSVAPGCGWQARIFGPHDYWGNTGKEICNYYILDMETYIFGKGFTDVLNEPVPEKYYSIE